MFVARLVAPRRWVLSLITFAPVTAVTVVQMTVEVFVAEVVAPADSRPRRTPRHEVLVVDAPESQEPGSLQTRSPVHDLCPVVTLASVVLGLLGG